MRWLRRAVPTNCSTGRAGEREGRKMDTGEGRFEQVEFKDLEEKHRRLEEMREKYPNSKGVFTVGEEIEIRGSRFKVKDISPFGIKLKLLKVKE
jgi:hypothetical protein